MRRVMLTSNPSSNPSLVPTGDIGALGATHRKSSFRRLLETLFVEAPRSKSARWSIAASYAIAFSGLVILSLLRQTGVPAWNSLYAEDGQQFFQVAIHQSFFRAITAQYAGYLELWPRLVAEAARLFPARDLAPFMAIVGAATLAVTALLVFHAARGHLPSRLPRCILVASIVLFPLATGELLNNTVNSLWWLFFGTFWLLLWRPITYAEKLTALFFCGIAAASEPLVVLFLPIVAARLFTLRSLQEQFATVGWAIGLGLQAVVHVQTKAQAYMGSFHEIPKDYLKRVALAWLTGDRGTADIISVGGHLADLIGLLLFVSLVVVFAWTRQAPVRLFCLSALALSMLTFAVPVWLRGAGLSMEQNALFVGSRYSATPILLLISAILVRINSMRFMQDRSRSRAGRRRSRQAWAGMFLLLAVLLTPTWILDYRAMNNRTDGPAWSTAVLAATTACKGHKAAGGQVVIPTTPEGWSVEIPCSRLEQDRAPTPPEHLGDRARYRTGHILGKALTSLLYARAPY
jgi:hypothetical protein